mmetsp:Transcript_8049/g.20586  ORF Transcript_8049/g.20586 Transcript_8049/m.20586 type:complete len:329 (-) Transcript_8049:73-1059(-)
MTSPAELASVYTAPVQPSPQESYFSTSTHSSKIDKPRPLIGALVIGVSSLFNPSTWCAPGPNAAVSSKEFTRNGGVAGPACIWCTNDPEGISSLAVSAMLLPTMPSVLGGSMIVEWLGILASSALSATILLPPLPSIMVKLCELRSSEETFALASTLRPWMPQKFTRSSVCPSLPPAPSRSVAALAPNMDTTNVSWPPAALPAWSDSSRHPRSRTNRMSSSIASLAIAPCATSPRGPVGPSGRAARADSPSPRPWKRPTKGELVTAAAWPRAWPTLSAAAAAPATRDAKRSTRMSRFVRSVNGRLCPRCASVGARGKQLAEAEEVITE